MNLQYIKLINGEDIIANVLDDSKKKIIIMNPACMRQMMGPMGITLGMTTWFPIYNADQPITISRNNIIAIVPASEELKKSYDSFLDKFKNKEPLKFLDPEDSYGPEEEEFAEELEEVTANTNVKKILH